MDTKGCTRYHEPNIADPHPSTSRTYTMAREWRTWVDRVTSLSNFSDHVVGVVPADDNRQQAPAR